MSFLRFSPSVILDCTNIFAASSRDVSIIFHSSSWSTACSSTVNTSGKPPSCAGVMLFSIPKSLDISSKYPMYFSATSLLYFSLTLSSEKSSYVMNTSTFPLSIYFLRYVLMFVSKKLIFFGSFILMSQNL